MASFKQIHPEPVFMPMSTLHNVPFEQSIPDDVAYRRVIPTDSKNKPMKRLGQLYYQAENDNSLVRVPDIWYNQTVEMRQSWWTFEVQRSQEAYDKLMAQYKEVCEHTSEYYEGQPTKKVKQNLEWALEDRARLLASVKQILQDLVEGVSFN